jgi:3-hydroxyacyl-CoA dehydrogenase
VGHRVPFEDELAGRRYRAPFRKPQTRSGENFDAFVITNDAPNFSVGANRMLPLMSAQEEEWDAIDLAISAFQGMTHASSFPKPVRRFIRMTLAVESMSLHAAARQPTQLYMGLVEVGAGLLPGGGCEMPLRATTGERFGRGDAENQSR